MVTEVNDPGHGNTRSDEAEVEESGELEEKRKVHFMLS
jgi:hypothetical protein